MKNLLNIDDQVVINMPGVIGDGETVKITNIDFMNGEVYYIGVYHQKCPNGGDGYDTSIQFKEGQYISNTIKKSSSSMGEISISVALDGMDNVKEQLDNLEVQLNRILDKIAQVKEYR